MDSPALAAARSRFRDIGELVLAWVVLQSLERTPRPLAESLARAYLHLADRAIPRLRRVAERNLALALPELDERQRQAIVAGVFRSIARLLVSVAKFSSIRRENLDRWIRFEGYEY